MTASSCDRTRACNHNRHTKVAIDELLNQSGNRQRATNAVRGEGKSVRLLRVPLLLWCPTCRSTRSIGFCESQSGVAATKDP